MIFSKRNFLKPTSVCQLEPVPILTGSGTTSKAFTRPSSGISRLRLLKEGTVLCSNLTYITL